MLLHKTGALRWIHKLHWPGIEGFDSVPRETLVDPYTQEPEMFYKSYENFHMYWVLKAGHAVCIQNLLLTFYLLLY